MVIFQRINTQSTNNTDIPLTHSPPLDNLDNQSPTQENGVVQNVFRHRAIEMTQFQTSSTNLTRTANQVSAVAV